MGIINEPTAAGLAYSKQLYSGSTPSNILIFDLGGGTFDVSMITITGSVVDVKATDGEGSSTQQSTAYPVGSARLSRLH